MGFPENNGNTVLNPYAAPVGSLDPFDPLGGDDISVRKQFIDCEANVRSIGSVLTIGGLAVVMVFGIVGWMFFVDRHTQPKSFWIALLCWIPVAIGVSQIFVGFGVRRLDNRHRIGAIVFCALWILFVPVGTLIGGVSLWYLLRPAATYVFTKQYRNIVERTPIVEFSTSVLSWILLAIVLAGGFGAIMLFSWRLS